MKENKLYQSGLCNYYGCVDLYDVEEGYFITLENFNGKYGYAISKKTYLSLTKDIPGDYTEICQKCYGAIDYWGHECNDYIKNTLKGSLEIKNENSR